MTRVYPAFVAEAGLDRERLADLEGEADLTTSRRSLPGTVAYALLAMGFSLWSDLGRLFPLFSLSMTLAGVAASAVRIRTMAMRPEDGPGIATSRVAWRRRAHAATFASVGVYALHVSGAIHLLGIGMTTMVMIMASIGLTVGIAHGLAPWQSLMRACAILLPGLPLCATLSTGSPAKYGLAALLGAQLLYVLFLGNRLGIEYWQSACAQAQLRVGRDELLRSQGETRELIEKTPDAMGVLCEDHIVFVNPTWTSSLEYESADILGRTLESLACPEDRERLRRFLAAPNPGVASEEFRVLKRDGTVVTWEIRPGQTMDYQGRVARPVVARDVTERNRLRTQLLLSERLASLGTLAAGVAHEINNPLTFVLANLDHVREEICDDAMSGAEARRGLSDILAEAWQGAERVRIIVRDLKTFSRVDNAAPGAVDLAKVIDYAAKITANELGPRARFVRGPLDVPPVVANEGQLGQVVVNLLLNAAHAIPEGHADKNEIRISARSDGPDHVLIEVGDTGVGIAPGHLSRIFDPFFTTKPVGAGTGLGLSICHASVRSFGGELSVASDVGRGTTFVVRLLRAREAARASIKPSVRVPRGLARVLVVDDEVAVGRALQRSLRGRYDVVVESSATAALARLESGESFDLLLCDLMMPGMSGMDLFAHIGDRLPEYSSKMVFMTGGAFTPKATAFLEQVVNPRIEKPFNLKELDALLAEKLPSSATSLTA